jgi:hypothetical protein
MRTRTARRPTRPSMILLLLQPHLPPPTTRLFATEWWMSGRAMTPCWCKPSCGSPRPWPWRLIRCGVPAQAEVVEPDLAPGHAAPPRWASREYTSAHGLGLPETWACACLVHVFVVWRVPHCDTVDQRCPFPPPHPLMPAGSIPVLCVWRPHWNLWSQVGTRALLVVLVSVACCLLPASLGCCLTLSAACCCVLHAALCCCPLYSFLSFLSMAALTSHCWCVLPTLP